jgi:hypothetical protein
MLRLLERNIASVDERLVLVAPPDVSVPECFQNTVADPVRHEQLVREMQRLRGTIYLQDGAVRRDQLTPDGLHQTPEDERSWHLLMLNGEGRVSSCAWYMVHDESAGFDHLRVRHCLSVQPDGWRQTLRLAVESEMERARAHGLRYAELGGWAVSPESRCTSEVLLLALATYSLGRSLGGGLGLTTATVRHSSAQILRRLGGSLLEWGGTLVPSYFDPRYNCEMEIIRFDSRTPGGKYSAAVDLIGRRLASVPVVAAGRQVMPMHLPQVLGAGSGYAAA